MANNRLEESDDLDEAFARVEALLPKVVTPKRANQPLVSGRMKRWQCEDGHLVGYNTTSQERPDGKRAFEAFLMDRLGRKTTVVSFKTRREAKAAAIAAFYHHSPRRAEKHGWNGMGFGK